MYALCVVLGGLRGISSNRCIESTCIFERNSAAVGIATCMTRGSGMAEWKCVGITPCRPGSWLLHGMVFNVYVVILSIMLRVERFCFNIVRLASANNHGFVKIVTFKFRTADKGHSGEGVECLVFFTLYLYLRYLCKSRQYDEHGCQS